MFSLLLVLAACQDAPTPPAAQEALPVIPPVSEGVEEEVPGDNQPPVITAVELMPENPQTNVDIFVRTKVDDADRDVVRTERTWFVNDERIPGANSFLPSSYYEKGDVVHVEVLATDGKIEVARTSAKVRIVNASPTIQNRIADLRKIDGFQIRAVDADGDPLTYGIEGAPPQLTIDASRGILRYQGNSTDRGGNFDITATVNDGDGGFAKWSFKIAVTAGSAGQPQVTDVQQPANGEPALAVPGSDVVTPSSQADRGGGRPVGERAGERPSIGNDVERATTDEKAERPSGE